MSFNSIATVTVCNDFGAQENKICHWQIWNHEFWDCQRHQYSNIMTSDQFQILDWLILSKQYSPMYIILSQISDLHYHCLTCFSLCHHAHVFPWNPNSILFHSIFSQDPNVHWVLCYTMPLWISKKNFLINWNSRSSFLKHVQIYFFFSYINSILIFWRCSPNFSDYGYY